MKESKRGRNRKRGTLRKKEKGDRRSQNNFNRDMATTKKRNAKKRMGASEDSVLRSRITEDVARMRSVGIDKYLLRGRAR